MPACHKQRLKRAGGLAFRRAVSAAARLLDLGAQLVEELPVVAYSARFERVAIDGSYAAQPRYLEDGWHERGLCPYERRALASFFPEPPARLLMHGVGGGRELAALLAAGYAVEGYEPVGRLVDHANGRLASCGAPLVRTGSMQSWATEPSGTFDGVFLGWGAWGHVIRRADRLAVLGAFRRVCPTGPVFLSFYRGEPPFDFYERVAEPDTLLHPHWDRRAQRFMRDVVRERWLRLPPIERGTYWNALKGCFFHATEEWELREEVNAAGYEVAFLEANAWRFPNAVLLPRA